MDRRQNRLDCRLDSFQTRFGLGVIPVFNRCAGTNEPVNVDGGQRKRGRYNNHRRDISLRKPKSTRYEQHQVNKEFATTKTAGTPKEPENTRNGDDKIMHDLCEFICDAADEGTAFTSPDVSVASPSIHEDMTSTELSSDDDMNIDFTALSEGCERSDGESFSDEEGELLVCDGTTQTIESTDEDPFVYPGSPLKLSESIFLILTLAVAHNRNGSCLANIISLIHLYCIPRPLNKCISSLSALKKYFVDLQLPIAKHFYCNVCNEYLGVMGSTPRPSLDGVPPGFKVAS